MQDEDETRIRKKKRKAVVEDSDHEAEDLDTEQHTSNHRNKFKVSHRRVFGSAFNISTDSYTY